jgi:hypothetical protein
MFFFHWARFIFCILFLVHMDEVPDGGTGEDLDDGSVEVPDGGSDDVVEVPGDDSVEPVLSLHNVLVPVCEHVRWLCGVVPDERRHVYAAVVSVDCPSLWLCLVRWLRCPSM